MQKIKLIGSIGLLAVVVAVAAPAVAGDRKIHGAGFCKVVAGENALPSYVSVSGAYGVWGYRVGGDVRHYLTCPFVRDDTSSTDMPYVVVEGYNAPIPSSYYPPVVDCGFGGCPVSVDGYEPDPSCTVAWFEEDENYHSGSYIRGTSVTKSTDEFGSFQFIFDANEYSSSDSLSGSEGSMHMSCLLHPGDELRQYTVEEGMY